MSKALSKTLIVAICAGGTLALNSAALAQSGERCEIAIPINGEGTTLFDSTGFASDGSAGCVTNSSADIWFLYSPSITGYVSIDTCGSSFDTVLTVVVDCFHEIACDDDSCALQSVVPGLQVGEGNSIFIGVAEYGLDGTGGPGVLNINVTAAPPWDEEANGGGDAGEFPDSALTPTGTNPLSQFTGSFASIGDADFYLIDICDPSNFSATTAGLTDDFFDTRLFIFNLDGTGVAFNDDVPLGFPGDDTLLSRVSGQFVTTPGQYYLCVTMYDNTPMDAAGDALWEEEPYAIERQPDGPGSGAVASWSHTGFDEGPYGVTLTGACFVGGGGPACDPDVNQDGNVDQGDIDYLINVVGGGENPTGIDADFNRDGNVDQGDVDALLNVVAGAPCP